MKTVLRYIGAIVLPFLAGWGVLIVGKVIVITGRIATNEYSDFAMTPLKAIIILFLFEFFAGYAIVTTAYTMAPQFKKLIAYVVATVVITGILYLFHLRYVLACIVGIAGMSVYFVRLYKERKKNTYNKNVKQKSDKSTRSQQPEVYF